MRQRLVLAMCSTLALGVLGLGSIAIWEARHEAELAATVRLETAARQTADLLSRSLALQRTQALTVARDTNVRVIAHGVGGALLDSARARIIRADSSTAAIRSIEIWDTTGAVLFASSDWFGGIRDSVRSLLLGRLAGGDSVGTGRLVLHNDSLAYATIAAIDSARSSRRVVIWRVVASNTAETRPLLEIIGPNSRLVVGNARGVVWTDLNQRAAAPPVGAADSALAYTRDDGVLVLARRAPVEGSLWDAAVEFPMAEVLAPAQRLTRAMAVASLLLLVLGALIAWALGRSFGLPIGELAEATEAVRAGDYSRRVPATRRDEFGDLARAFNTMADAVSDARGKLQERAEDLQRRGDALAEQSRQTEDANAQLRVAVADAERSRRSLQSALNENTRTNAELNAALASAPVAFGFHDTSMRFVRVNERLASFVGRQPSEIVGRLPSEVMPTIGPNVELALARALETGAPVLDLELTGDHGGEGTERQWLATLFPIRTDAGTIGLGSVMLDMTDYRLLEQRFLHAQRMEAVGRLAGGIAHDFNNILTAIGSFNEFAIKELAPEHPAVEDLEQVSMAVTRATALIRQLLAFSRHQVMEPVVIDLSDVVRNLVPMLRRLIPESVQLRHDLRDEVFPVLMDPVRIEQVLVNLVVNAADAMPDGGRLVISTQAAVVDSATPGAPAGIASGRYAILSVADSGTGMDLETQARAFEPFFTTKSLGRGTGLGLSTVSGIVRQSGGSIRIDSALGAGTTITIYFPHHDAPAPVRPAPAVRVAARAGKATILLVEDELLVRLAIRRILTSQGHHVIEATDGEAALSVLARQSRVDLVISDLVMPRLGGRELGERMRTRGLTARILFMSGYTGEFATRQSLLDANAEFIEKPFSPEDLLHKVDELLGMPVVKVQG